jgi:hypothetical protein
MGAQCNACVCERVPKLHHLNIVRVSTMRVVLMMETRQMIWQ